MRRIELAAQNIANVSTPGYRSYRAFADALEPVGLSAKADPQRTVSVDFASGKLQSTGNPLDLAISGPGFFELHSADGVFYTRNGQFVRDAEGDIATLQGLKLQSTNGDIRLSGTAVKVVADGAILDGEEPVARLAVVDFDDLNVLEPAGGGLFRAPSGAAHQLEAPQIRQGMLENSNVSVANEMVSIMASLRSAEGGQRVVQIYDDLMGRAITTFGQ